jgi:hypothetical protein
MTMTFDPIQYKETTRRQWEQAAEAWHRGWPTLKIWLGSATERMVDLAGARTDGRVLHMAATAFESCRVRSAPRVGLW